MLIWINPSQNAHSVQSILIVCPDYSFKETLKTGISSMTKVAQVFNYLWKLDASIKIKNFNGLKTINASLGLPLERLLKLMKLKYLTH